MEPLSFRRDTDVEKYQFASELPYRPGTNTTGKAVQIRVNQFKVTQWPTKDVYQFDVCSPIHIHLMNTNLLGYRFSLVLVLRSAARSTRSGTQRPYKTNSVLSQMVCHGSGMAIELLGMFISLISNQLHD